MQAVQRALLPEIMPPLLMLPVLPVVVVLLRMVMLMLPRAVRSCVSGCLLVLQQVLTLVRRNDLCQPSHQKNHHMLLLSLLL
jgi:hypothetical protein